MQTYVTILTAGTVTLPIGMEGHAVDRTEVALHAAELLFEYQVEESRVELADAGGRRRHVHGVLTAAQHHVVQNRGDGGRIDGTLRLVGLQRQQVFGVEEFRGVVLRSGDEHRPVLVELHVVDEEAVFFRGVYFFTRLKKS